VVVDAFARTWISNRISLILAVNLRVSGPYGGLKSFGHPIGATGLRMLFECWLQLRGLAPADRQIASTLAGRSLGLTHNLGGAPGECVSFVGVVGSELDT
jgi:acetyl-CoA C-acetyltransferase